MCSELKYAADDDNANNLAWWSFAAKKGAVAALSKIPVLKL